MKIRGILKRLLDSGLQTIGHFNVYDEVKHIYEAYSLELSWKDNQRNISCIPKGIYTVVPRFTEHRGWHYHITGVPDRSLILIHVANDHEDIEGCIGLGTYVKDLNQDGHLDIALSGPKISELWDAIGNQEWELEVI